jgi:hypothetical protein
VEEVWEDEGVEDIKPTNLINKAMTSLFSFAGFFKLDNVAKAAVRNLMPLQKTTL